MATYIAGIDVHSTTLPAGSQIAVAVADGFAGAMTNNNINNPIFAPAFFPFGTTYPGAAVAATGTTQGTAALITAGGVTKVASATGGSAFGLLLPSNSAGQGQDTIVLNPTAVSVAVYPPVGGTLNGQAANIPVYVPPGWVAEFFAATDNGWIAQLVPPTIAAQVFTTSASAVSFTATGPNIMSALVETDFLLSGTLASGQNVTLPTVAALVTQMYAIGVVPIAGASYKLRVINASAGAFSWTMVTNTSWTLTGTMTVAQNTWRDFIITFTGAAAATLQSVGTGTYS